MFGVELGNYGPASLLAMFVVAILVGALIPRWTHNRIVRKR